MERIGQILGGIVVAVIIFAGCYGEIMGAADNATTPSDPVEAWIEDNPEKFDSMVEDQEEFERLLTSFVNATNAFAEATYDPNATVRDFEDAVRNIHRTGGALRVNMADRVDLSSTSWQDMVSNVFEMEDGFDDALAAIHSNDTQAYDRALSRISAARAEMLRLATSMAYG